MITAIKGYNPKFEAAQVNILATSDNHGNVHSLPRLTKTIEENQKEIFIKKDEKSTLNIFAIVGDWFINPSKKGFLTKPDMSNGDIQQLFLNKTIDFVHDLAGRKRDNFAALFAMGNHDLDGGDKFIYKVIKESPMHTLVTNVDLKKSPVVKEMMDDDVSKAVRAKVFSIPDDKNPNLKHKVLFVGVTIPSMDFYNPGLLKNMDFLDNCNKKDANLKEIDLAKTFDAVASEVYKFKFENPKGAVILMSHTGAAISKMIKNYVPEIDVILNGHDHKNLTFLEDKTNINSLGKDNEIIKSINLRFDDNGNLKNTAINTYHSRATLMDDIKKNPFYKALKDNFSKDMKPLIKLKGDDVVSELGYADEIRFQNSYLANYLTSAVKRSVREICPDVDVVAIQSSIIRGGLKNKSNNLDIKKIFDGVSEDLSDVKVGSIKGRELIGVIVENVESNLANKTRNTIIQWSDIKIDKDKIAEIFAKNPNKDHLAAEDFIDAIEIRNQDSDKKTFEHIDLDKEYKIAIGDKYLVKDDITWPRMIRDRFVSLGMTYDQLFNEYLKSVNYDIKITAKTKEQRIIFSEKNDTGKIK